MDPCYLLFILLLIKLSGTQDVTTVQKISVQRGRSVLIPCLYKQEYSKDFSVGCYGDLNQHTELSDQRYNPKPVILSNDNTHQIFTVRMDNVQESDECWCGVRPPRRPEKRTSYILEVTAGPSRLHVSNQNVTGSESVTVTCYHHRKHKVKWCKVGGRCVRGTSETLEGASVEIRYSETYMTVTMNELKKENTGWYLCSSVGLQMPVHITVKPKMRLTTIELPQPISNTSARKRTVFLLPLSVILEILLFIIIYAAWRLCRERCLVSKKQEAEDSHYVVMHRKQSSHQTVEEEYENMSGINESNIQEPDYVNVTKT